MWLIKHLRHSRGYGIHSPFLYRIVRESMMPRQIVANDDSLYRALRTKGADRRTAIQLQNLYEREHYPSWSIDKSGDKEALTIATESCSEVTIRSMAQSLKEHNGTLCILHKPLNRQRKGFCRAIVAEHHSMSAEKRKFTLLFSRHDLRKQHIVI